MSNVMGLKCWGDRFSFVVLSGSLDKILLIRAKHVKLPAASSRPAQLAAFRQDIYDLLTQLKIESVCFRAQEAIAQKKSLTRAELEGVLQEACESLKPSVPVAGRTVIQFKSILHYTGKANEVFTLGDREETRSLAKTNFADAIVAAMSLLPQ